MKVQDVLSCSFPNWYEKFKGVTIPSIILPIPSNVLTYLQENGTLVLPEGSYTEVYDRGKTNDSDDSSTEWEDESKDSAVAIAPNLDEFNERIKGALKRLGGKAFPKLNWSSPKDASWISFNKSLQCQNPADVYLLLKSSDFVSHDLTSPFKDCVDKSAAADQKLDYCLILRQWIEANPSDEFRCFVRNRQLVGISQRDISQYYYSIHKEKDNIMDDIALFWDEHVRNYFPLLSYAFDVHRPKDGHVTLIDFGPFGPTTDSLMFSWQELDTKDDAPDSTSHSEVDSNRLTEISDEEPEPDMRYITGATGVQPSPYMRYGLPVDIVDLSTGQDQFKLADFLQMKIQKGDDVSSSEEDEDLSLAAGSSSLSNTSNSSTL